MMYCITLIADVVVIEENGLLTPYAQKHLDDIKAEACKYTVNLIKEDEYTVWKISENYRPHLLNWSSRSCSNCHKYAETRMPCVHLYAVWLQHKTKGLCTRSPDGTTTIITKSDEAYKHFFGKCYLSSTLKSVIDTVSNARPVSLDSISIDENQGSLMLNKMVKKGRPQKKRKASSIDNHRTGSKQKLIQLNDISNVENENEISSSEIEEV